MERFYAMWDFLPSKKEVFDCKKSIFLAREVKDYFSSFKQFCLVKKPVPFASDLYFWSPKKNYVFCDSKSFKQKRSQH